MVLISKLLLLSLALVLLLKLGSFLLAEKVVLSREELSPYECGFEHHNVSRIPFSLRYFFLTLIFLLFDLEVILLLFLPSLIFSVSPLILVFLLFLFLSILYLGLIYEWNDGSLEWLH